MKQKAQILNCTETRMCKAHGAAVCPLSGGSKVNHGAAVPFQVGAKLTICCFTFIHA